MEAVKTDTIIGLKEGMTRVFDKEGNAVAVTVVRLVKQAVAEVKTEEKCGYDSLKIAYGEKRLSLSNKSQLGILKKAGITENYSKYTEVKTSQPLKGIAAGQPVDFSDFKAGVIVDVIGVSKGKGFQGVMKRYNFQGGPAAHGSHFHRRPGSIGCRATPARVFANKKMPGHMGNEKVTIQNLQIYELNESESYLLIKGSVPGPKNGIIKISKAHKS